MPRSTLLAESRSYGNEKWLSVCTQVMRAGTPRVRRALLLRTAPVERWHSFHQSLFYSFARIDKPMPGQECQHSHLSGRHAKRASGGLSQVLHP
jgi:hypothetical protein